MRIPVLIVLLAFASAATAADAPPVAVPPAPTFSTKPLSAVATHPERSAPAGVVSANESRLSAELAARIVELPAEVGEVVAAGSVVARLDGRDAAIEVQRAEAGLAGAQARAKQADAQLKRTEELAAKNFVSPDALQLKQTDADARRADAQAAQAAVAAARRAVEKTTVRAPFKAVVRARHASVGEMAAPGAPLLTLVDLSRLEVSAQVPGAFAATLPKATEIFWESAGRREAVKLLRVSPAINREARNVEVRLAFRAPPPGRPKAGQAKDMEPRSGEPQSPPREGRLGGAGLFPAPAPGLEGRIVWRDPRPHLAPELIVRREAGLGVFVLEAGKAHFVVLPDAQEGRPASADFLPAAAQVVVSGQQALREGMVLK